MGLEPVFLAGSCMASLLHLTLRFSKNSKTFEDNQNKSETFLKICLTTRKEEREKEKKNIHQLTSKRCSTLN